jgi:hypothetical protein
MRMPEISILRAIRTTTLQETLNCKSIPLGSILTKTIICFLSISITLNEEQIYCYVVSFTSMIDIKAYLCISGS